MCLSEDIHRIKEVMGLITEEIRDGEVICDNCGWSWKLSEGGHDKYICHKCNHNNEPNKLKEQTLTPDAIKTFLIKRPLLDKVFKNFFGIAISMNERRLFVDEVLGGVKKVFEDVSKFIDSPHEIEECGAYDFKFKFKPYNYSDELLRVDGSASVDVDATLTLHLGENLTPTTKSLREWFKDEDSGWEIRIEVIDCINDFFYENVFKKTGVVVDVDDIDFDFEK